MIKVLKNDIVSAGIVLDLVTSYVFMDFRKYECDPRSRPIYVFTFKLNFCINMLPPIPLRMLLGLIGAESPSPKSR